MNETLLRMLCSWPFEVFENTSGLFWMARFLFTTSCKPYLSLFRKIRLTISISFDLVRSSNTAVTNGSSRCSSLTTLAVVSSLGHQKSVFHLVSMARKNRSFVSTVRCYKHRKVSQVSSARGQGNRTRWTHSLSSWERHSCALPSQQALISGFPMRDLIFDRWCLSAHLIGQISRVELI